ncbi:MAG: c-type cytochrome, partial [Chloroflexi bacterium]|nr:c-type cytochrome [Chloroflexota bacterium]
LNDYQIGELVDLIRFGDWQATQDRVVNLGLAPLVPFATEPDPEILEELAGMPDGDILAQGITVYAQQCVACHGADGLGTSLAPPLNDPAVSTQSIDELERTLLYGVPGTLMAGWENALSGEEVSAVLTLITQWDQVSPGAIPAPEVPVPVTEESLVLGADMYAANCSRCHAAEGQGTQRASSLNVKGYLEDTSDAALQQIITLGVSATAMPAWGDKMTEAEIQAIVGFMRAWEPIAPEVAEPARGGGGGGPWWQTEGDSSPGRGGKGNGQGGPPDGAGQGAADHTESVTPADGVQEPGVSGPPADASLSEGAEGMAADQTSVGEPGDLPDDSVKPGQDNMAADQIPEEGPGGPPEWASANIETGGQGQAEGGGHDLAEGEIPPWASVEQPQSWWNAMDARAWAVVLGSAILAMGLMSVAFFGLRRLPKL